MRVTQPRVTEGPFPLSASILIYRGADVTAEKIEITLSPRMIDLLIADLSVQRVRINTLSRTD